jgi:thiamine biosynthesis lipoprotein
MGNLVKFIGIIIAFVAGLPLGYAQTLNKYFFERPALGSKATITCIAADSLVASNGTQAAFALLDSFDHIFSDYKEDSEAMLLANRAKDKWIPISYPLYDLIHKSEIISAATDGKFTIAIGALTQLWRAHLGNDEVPRKKEIRKAARLAKEKLFELTIDPYTIKKRKQALRFDFGGIAKGYIADHMAKALREMGITIFLINLGGDLVAGDKPPNQTGWKITIPWCDKVVHIANQAIATSGPDFQFFVHKGVRYAHIIDPTTGWGVPNYFATTVIARYGWQADAYASAFSILPLKRSQEVLELEKDISAIIGAGNELLYSKNFSDYILN